MKLGVVTLFPELFGPLFATSFMARAEQAKKCSYFLEPLREHGLGKHRSVDDTPYGGGSGMVLRPDVVWQAVQSLEARMGGRTHRILLCPQGKPLDQRKLRELVSKESLSLICGRYEGFDERVREFVDEEISLGDFVLNGGEVAAMALLEGVVRLLPGVLGNEASVEEESFAGSGSFGLLEYPQYTRPLEFSERAVPEVLRGGDHEKIRTWREERRLARTLERRPDLLLGLPALRRVALALVHHPVLDREGAVVTTAITNIDLHDLARSAHTFGVERVFVVHPIEAQRALAQRVKDHWVQGAGARRIPDRATAMQVLEVVPSVEDAILKLGKGKPVELWATSAKSLEGGLGTAEARARLSIDGPSVLLLFGTGWGLAEQLCQQAAVSLAPITSPRKDGYNHLSVRAAVAILLARLLGHQ